MHRFYLPSLTSSSQNIQITNSAEIHHLKNVLRIKNNTRICLFNGKGAEVTALVQSFDKHAIDCKVEKILPQKIDQTSIILACAIPKKSKFETIIEKATELGVREIYPVITKKTLFNLHGDRLIKKHQRYMTVAINAAKQSKLKVIPSINIPIDFQAAIEQVEKRSIILIPSLEKGSVPILKALGTLPRKNPIAIFIGPEGDFSPYEYRLAQKHGCKPVSLGPTTLKVETAAICALSCTAQFLHK